MFYSKFESMSKEHLAVARETLNERLFSRGKCDQTIETTYRFLKAYSSDNHPIEYEIGFVRKNFEPMINWLAEVSFCLPFYLPSDDVLTLFLDFARAHDSKKRKSDETMFDLLKEWSNLDFDNVSVALQQCMEAFLGEINNVLFFSDLNMYYSSKRSFAYYKNLLKPFSFYNHGLLEQLCVECCHGDVLDGKQHYEIMYNLFLYAEAVTCVALCDMGERSEREHLSDEAATNWAPVIREMRSNKTRLLEFLGEFFNKPVDCSNRDWPFDCAPDEIFERLMTLKPSKTSDDSDDDVGLD